MWSIRRDKPVRSQHLVSIEFFQDIFSSQIRKDVARVSMAITFPLTSA